MLEAFLWGAVGASALLVGALGADLDDLLEHLEPWSDAIIAAKSYPDRIAGVYNTGGARTSARA